MGIFTSAYALYLFSVIGSLIISLYVVRKVLFITQERKIYDLPDDTRKIHGAKIPSLGGIGIFIAYGTISTFLAVVGGWNFIMVSSLLLFFTGIYDDLMNMSPAKKLLLQFIASFITVCFAEVQLHSLYGLFGINDMPYYLGLILTTLACTFFINVFNFADGIDGLACGLAILYTTVLAYLFTTISHTGVACMAFSLLGAVLGLLYYNRAPAKIYMGDTGSMLLGFSIFTLTLLFINRYSQHGSTSNAVHSLTGAMILMLSILFLPIFDGVRVFIIRASKGISPLRADRTHLHYYLLDAGCTHTQAVFALLSTNIAIIGVAFLLQDLNPQLALLGMSVPAFVTLGITYGMRKKRVGSTSTI